MLFLVTSLISSISAQAQQRCIQAMDVQTRKVVEELCVGQRVRFKDCSGNLRPEVYYDFDFKATHQNLTDTTSFHTYTRPGTYVVSQFARNNQGVDGSTTRTYLVKPQPLTAPQFPKLQSLRLEGPASPGAATFTLQNLQAGYTYIIEQAPAGSFAFSPLDTLRPTASGDLPHQLNDLETGTTRCYRLRATGFCGGSPDVSSDVLCSQGLAVAAGDRLIQLTWPAYPGSGLTGYRLFRDNTMIAEQPPTATGFQDREVACGRSYCYRLEAVLPGDRSSASLSDCAQATSTTPPKPARLHTSFNPENQVVVTLLAPADETVREVTVQRSLNQGAFVEAGKTGTSPFMDAAFRDFSATVCYQATYQDLCGLSSGPSARSCPAILRIAQYDEAGVRLEWTAYEGFEGGVEQYQVELLGGNNTVVASFPAGTATTFTDPDPNNQLEVLRYRVLALAANPAETSYSNIVTLDREFQLYLPNAFTPNGDGLNDRFEVKGRLVASFRMVIYNRWGQVVFQSNDPKMGWDGRINGQEAPVGTYAYTLEAADGNGRKFSRKGTVTLLR